MTQIEFTTNDPALAQLLEQQLQQDLQQAGLEQDLTLSETVITTENATRSLDPTTWATIAVTAAGAGGALTVLLSKDGFLDSLARVLEKYVEGRRTSVSITKDDGTKIDVNGPASEIKDILKEIKAE